jgi:hypothetical protein
MARDQIRAHAALARQQHGGAGATRTMVAKTSCMGALRPTMLSKAPRSPNSSRSRKYTPKKALDGTGQNRYAALKSPTFGLLTAKIF